MSLKVPRMTKLLYLMAYKLQSFLISIYVLQILSRFCVYLHPNGQLRKNFTYVPVTYYIV